MLQRFLSEPQAVTEVCAMAGDECEGMAAGDRLTAAVKVVEDFNKARKKEKELRKWRVAQPPAKFPVCDTTELSGLFYDWIMHFI